MHTFDFITQFLNELATQGLSLWHTPSVSVYRNIKSPFMCQVTVNGITVWMIQLLWETKFPFSIELVGQQLARRSIESSFLF